MLAGDSCAIKILQLKRKSAMGNIFFMTVCLDN